MDRTEAPGGTALAGIEGLALMLWAADARAPERLAVPFVQAAVAAAMELQVEIYFTAASVELLVPGTAQALRTGPLSVKTIQDEMCAAVAQGAVLLACSEALAARGLETAPLISECSGRGGLVQFTARAADPRWRALVF